MIEIIKEIEEVMKRLRVSVSQRDMKELAYNISIFSWMVWDMFRQQEATELKYKIEESKLIDKLVKSWVSHNKAKEDAKVKLTKYAIEQSKAKSEYKKAMLLKESYTNFMWICKQDLADWWNTDIMANAFSNIRDD